MQARELNFFGLKVGPGRRVSRPIAALFLWVLAAGSAHADPGPLSHPHPRIIEVVAGQTSAALGPGYYLNSGPTIYLEVEFGGLGFIDEDPEAKRKVRFFQVETYLEQSGKPALDTVHFKMTPLAFNTEVSERFSHSTIFLPITYQRELDFGMNHSVTISAVGISGEASTVNGWAIKAAAEALGLQMAAIHQDPLQLGAFLVATEFGLLKRKRVSKSLQFEVTLFGLEQTLSQDYSIVELFSRVSLNLKNGISVYLEANAGRLRPGVRNAGEFGVSRDDSVIIAVSIPLF